MTGEQTSPDCEPSGRHSATQSAARDAGLVAQIAKREEAAFREVIVEHSPILHRIAYRMIGEAQEAEDIVQEAMLRLWDNAPKLSQNAQGSINLGAWLKRVTVNLALDRIRLAKRIAGNEVPEQEDGAPLSDARIVESEQVSLARAMITQLPENQRAAIVLTYYEEMPNSEAAEAMDLNIKAFESLLYRARTALRNAYEAHEQGDAR
ncbi:hypothetical protein EH31_06725 [Erythrobacter longus]|uniref:RNA polymerase sigma factor n=1 Tax=Erythrobacter longus TaxID=1044 RepID=A0A074MFU7_ERYLO|nr:sigma-70 family RNA polymerase sigma factor [Erythrobacter longus]KEO90728.1 hypothetical protein EH31_06725 [Erythrobacter longus]